MSSKDLHLPDSDFSLLSFQRLSLALGLIVASSVVVVVLFFQPAVAAELKITGEPRQKGCYV